MENNNTVKARTDKTLPVPTPAIEQTPEKVVITPPNGTRSPDTTAPGGTGNVGRDGVRANPTAEKSVVDTPVTPDTPATKQADPVVDKTEQDPLPSKPAVTTTPPWTARTTGDAGRAGPQSVTSDAATRPTPTVPGVVKPVE
jgi:hypothetical protein